MPAALTLLDGVGWQGRPVGGDRPAALLAALAADPAGVGDARLIELVWGADPPGHPAKALQVLVSRLRTLDRELVVRTADGYRLGTDDVDAWQVCRLAAEAASLLRAGDLLGAGSAADAAVAHAVAAGGVGPLGALRRDVRRQLAELTRVRALALAGTGRAAEALPLLEQWHAAHRDDAELLAALLRAEATTAGAPAALARYAAYRADLADRLGVNPDPALQRVHAELLAADDPKRSGLRYDPDPLLGRSADLQRLRAALATARLTTVVGPGGIGKTRVAHVLAREATQPRVHVVELVGVVSGDDVVAEVGAALGVRDSVTSRRALTAAQQADVRARIAQELDGGPTLLVLDNCEHVLESVASLVAYLLVTTRDLRILTTSRAALRIAAERVVPLTQLAEDDAVALFTRRAVAVRPDADLAEPQVRRLVARLDGLPLAVELAAARVRTMSVSEIAAALSDRFAVLRSRDRTAPERHRTLDAVIGWSWELLSAEEQRALAWLSVFHDGLDAGGAVALLGPDGAQSVEALVEQSLLVVTEEAGSTRFRALETIREYAALRLDERGERAAASSAQEAWALGLVGQARSLFVSPDQERLVDVLVREENNLTEVLRRGLRRRDAPLVARLLGTLASLWTIIGEHARVFAIADAAGETLRHWTPPEELLEVAQDAACLVVLHQSWFGQTGTSELADALADWGPPRSPWAKATEAVFDDADPAGRLARLQVLMEAAERPEERAVHLLWMGVVAESDGAAAAARGYAAEALTCGELPSYLQAALRSQLAQLALQAGDHRGAAEHAEAAWPVMMRLHAHDDALSMRLVIAMSRLLSGDPDGCDRELDRIIAEGPPAQAGSRAMLGAARAEAALARGEATAGLAAYDAAVELLRASPDRGFGLAPWLAMAASGALIAHVRFGPDGARDRAEELRRLLTEEVLPPSGALAFTDLPFSGLVLLAVGAWELRWGAERARDGAVELLAIAHAWGYQPNLPVTAWAPLAELAEASRPGRLEGFLAAYGVRVPGDLRQRAADLVAGLEA